MKKILLTLFFIFIAGCNAKEPSIHILNPEFENVSFNVVQKQLIIESEIPDYVKILVSKWFDQRVKIDGYDGNMKFIISNFEQNISSINDGKRVDIYLSFKILLNKPSLSQTKIIDGSVSSYGTITGNFSLSDFDAVIQNSQSDLIVRLIKDLKSKI